MTGEYIIVVKYPRHPPEETHLLIHVSPKEVGAPVSQVVPADEPVHESEEVTCRPRALRSGTRCRLGRKAMRRFSESGEPADPGYLEGYLEAAGDAGEDCGDEAGEDAA
jgi:hypothetical protein